MQLSKGVEQATYVLLMLEIKGHRQPLKSSFLSRNLQVSDSSLKKLLRKLVLAQLIQSVASKDGGFRLARPLRQISLLDILLAVEGPHPLRFKSSHLARQIFDTGRPEHLRHSEQLFKATLDRAASAYEQELAKLTLDQLLDHQQR